MRETHAGLSGELASAWQARKPQSWGLVSDSREGSGQGLGQVCGLPCFRWFGAATPVQSACKCRQGQGPCRADSLQGMGRQRMAAVCFSSPKFSGSLLLYARLVFPLPAYPKIYQVKSFQVARNFPPCAARVFLPIFCARG